MQQLAHLHRSPNELPLEIVGVRGGVERASLLNSALPRTLFHLRSIGCISQSSNRQFLSAPSHKCGGVCKVDGAHAEGVDGGRRRPPAGFSGITRRAGAWWSAIGA